LATSTAFATAEVTSAPLLIPIPTLPLWSPSTTRARKRKRRPPFTTRATRSICTTRSSNCFSSAGWRLSCRPLRCSAILELQSSGAGCVSKRLYTAVVLLTAAVEHHFGDFSSLGLLCYFCTNPGRTFGHGAFGSFCTNGAYLGDGAVFGVINDLCADVLIADKNAQARTFSVASNAGADAVFASRHVL